MKNKLIKYKSLNKLLSELKEQAQELIEFGNSKETSQGLGMIKVINCIDNHNNICPTEKPSIVNNNY